MTAPHATRRVDVIVPIYNAPDDVRGCIASVLACTDGDYRLILIDDGSPDPEVRDVLREIGQLGLRRIEILRNERNLGFTATANRGMALSRADVVLLNSDTIASRGWLDALVRCAASDPRIATVTPFSNNAEICSFPRFCEDTPWPAHADPEPIRAALADAAVPTYPDLPTGVGFCMFIRRAAIDEVGTFDLVFGAGYGEENDFCLRAARAGWRNVLADDAFVVHTGARSFAGRKAELGGQNLARLLDRHPHYREMVERYIAADPLRALREAAQARISARTAAPGVLHVIHHHGGGTETHVRALIAASKSEWRHYLAVAVGERWQVEEHRFDGAIVTFMFTRERDERWRDFLAGVAATFEIALVHLHNISGCRDGLIEALDQGSIPFGYTLHDLNFACPAITFVDPDGRYCGGVTDRRTCQACVNAQPELGAVDVAAWRERHGALVARAAFVIAPSQWAASMLRRYFARDDIRVIAHGTEPRSEARAPGMRVGVLLPDDEVPVVVALGAIGPDKGARRIERLVELARERELPLRVVVVGYLDVERGPWQADDARLTVHGRYDPSDLPELLRHYRARFVLFPSAGPETFSYTLSEAWRAGVPALVPPIGALAERVASSGAGWTLTDDEWMDDARMLERVVSLAGANGAQARADAAARTRAVRHESPQSMAAATLALYAAAIGDGRPDDIGGPIEHLRAGRAPAVAAGRFTSLRVRDALGYRAWTPPADFGATDAPAPAGAPRDATTEYGLLGRVARRALSIRRTPMGRLLYRVTPTQLIEALKARLDG